LAILSPHELVAVGLKRPSDPWPKVFCMGCFLLISSTE